MHEALRVLFLCLLLTSGCGGLTTGSASAQNAAIAQGAHPFGLAGAPPASAAPAAPPAADPGAVSPWRRFWLWADARQQQLHRAIARDIMALRQRAGAEGGVDAGLMLIALSFIYGVLHALGPGHGKAVISSYAMAQERTVRRGVALSFAAALTQAVTAIAIGGVLALGVRATSMEIQTATARLESMSWLLIALTGCWLFYATIRRRWFAGARHDPVHRDHDHDGAACSCGHAHLPDAATLDGGFSPWRAVAIVLAVGVRPCTGALLALVFALQQGVFWAGALAVLAMALGTAITVSMLVILAVGSREVVASVPGRGGVWAARVHDVAALGGALLLMALGAALFIASLGPPRPFL